MQAKVKGFSDRACFFTYKTQRIAYWQMLEPDADGIPILFLHGFPSASIDWSELFTLFSKSSDKALLGDCHALDFLGFGFSDKPHPHAYSLLEQADIATAYLQAQNIKKVRLVAHDYGVSVAQELLARFGSTPQTVEITSVMFLNGGLFAEAHRPLLTQTLLKSVLGPVLVKCLSQRSLHRTFSKIFGRNTPPSSVLIAELWDLLQHAQGTRVLPAILSYLDERKTYRDHWVNAMQSTHVELGFVNGVQDPISGQHMLDAFTRLLPCAYTKALDVGHYPQLEDPNSVYLALIEFWQGANTPPE